MLGRITRRGAPLTVAAWLTLLWSFQGCAGRDLTIAESGDGGVPNAFVSDASDAGDGASDARDLVTYCPSSKCPAGYTNCPTSRFPCDVDLLTDRQNCGACGVACPVSTSTEYYECVDGHCVMQCSNYPKSLDCDGLADNGCETSPADQTSCGACGITCTEDKPCLNQASPAEDYGCGCRDGKTYCQGQCVDTRSSDLNCGACDVACPTGDLDPSLHMYLGCAADKCGATKCQPDYANCDGDLDNGCETDLTLPENCGGCGNECFAGQSCRKDVSSPAYTLRCMCPPGETFCGGSVYGTCYDTSSDARNCGGCDILCETTCVNGMCRFECGTGRANCNGNEADSCETNIDSDPNNCGGCGITCNAIAGQACVQGRCVVEPCDETVDAGRGPQ